MKLVTDFECGNGKDIRKVGERHFSVTEVGDRETYCYYFCFDLVAERPEDAGDVTVDVLGDPALKVPTVPNTGTRGLMEHTPCTIWVARWDEFHPLPGSRVEYLDDRIRMKLKLPADGTLRVTNVIPAYYTETVVFLKGCAARMPKDAEYIEIGKSNEGRPIPGIRITEGLKGRGRTRFVAFSGEHPIEFPGVFGTRGIADFLTSPLAEAAAIRKKYDVVVLPLVSPDGTFHGRNNFNGKGEEVYSAYENASDGTRPKVTESRAVWDFLQKPAPALALNIHCYCGLGSFVEWPYNGMYVLRDEAFRDEKQKRAQRIIDEHVRLRTNGLTGHRRPNQMTAVGLGHQLALKHGTFAVLYEINAATHGPTGAGREGVSCFKAMIEGYETARQKAEGRMRK